MRATISFELELDKVESTMATLVSQEAGTLRIVTNILDSIGEGPLLPEVSETIDLLQEVTNQLKQYQDMLVNFERAKFETILPQPATTLGAEVNSLREAVSTVKNMKAFDSFIEGMTLPEEDDDPEER